MQDLYGEEPDLEDHPEQRDTPTRPCAPAADSFAFDWRSFRPLHGDTGVLGLSTVRGRLEALRNNHGLSDKTVKPQVPSRSPSIVDKAVVADHCSPASLDAGSASGEFGALPEGVSGSAARIGNLRRYSSLNFELESSTSGASLNLAAEDSARELAPSPVRIRHARSILGLSFGSTEESLGAPSWTSKLRKRSRPGTPLPATAPQLPKGVQQIGEGIGYTRRSDVRRSVMTLASLTPRTCQSIFTGGLRRLGGKRKKEEPPPGEGAYQEAGAAEDDEEDPMDEVMREIYGADWAGGCSPTEMGAASVRICERRGGRVGLGWDETLTRFGTVPVDASFAGPDSTLRLVSPSTPRLNV
ncbi:hypothetical protein OH77DRAFT_1110417 [Trametes cingulata]|nr:hypothetical protein OH77DRAFT_1110417 [Trametes cingulata]